MKSLNKFQIFALVSIAWSSTQFLQTVSAQTDFNAPRFPGEGAYQFTTQYLTYTPDGSQISQESTNLEVEIEVDEKGQQHLICKSFSLKDAEGKIHEIPQLSGYTNEINISSDQVLGVDHADFIGLKRDDGIALPPELEYRVYNTFIDFYAFNNVFAQPAVTAEGESIADLKAIGQKIVHYSAYSEPPVDLGDSVKKGSYFRNGKVTLEWIGTGNVNGAPCEVVEFDSGESSFEMLMEPAPEVNIHAKGGSQYWGNLYINAKSLWLEKARFRELVISQIEVNGNPSLSNIIKRIGVIERTDQ